MVKPGFAAKPSIARPLLQDLYCETSNERPLLRDHNCEILTAKLLLQNESIQNLFLPAGTNPFYSIRDKIIRKSTAIGLYFKIYNIQPGCYIGQKYRKTLIDEFLTSIISPIAVYYLVSSLDHRAGF
jgi:hypothetical protein